MLYQRNANHFRSARGCWKILENLLWRLAAREFHATDAEVPLEVRADRTPRALQGVRHFGGQKSRLTQLFLYRTHLFRLGRLGSTQ